MVYVERTVTYLRKGKRRTIRWRWNKKVRGKPFDRWLDRVNNEIATIIKRPDVAFLTSGHKDIKFTRNKNVPKQAST